MTRVNPNSGTVSLSLPVIALLASLAVPRVVVHDLGLITSGTVNAILVFGPPIVWLLVVLRAKATNVFSTLLTIGLAYGLLLAMGHQVFWNAAFGTQAPALGGNLDGVLPPVAESIVLRAFSAVSSVFTGLLVGSVAGLAGWAVTGIRHALETRS